MMIVSAGHNGPPGTGNGGYTAGLIAGAYGAVEGALQVTLRVPPPLETPLSVVRESATLRVYDGPTLVAEARPAPAATAVPPVPAGAALAASATYAGFTDHPFPTCYVCGPQRPAGDGLRIFPGMLDDGRTAAPWTVPATVVPEVVWAALDCPGGWAIIGPGRPYVLGRIAASIGTLPRPGDECVVVGRVTAVAGRRAEVDTSLYGADGELLATAAATWIALRADA